ncbi:MAG TPA: GspH/FimT family pseudopilin [Longimicrobiales bacterium]
MRYAAASRHIRVFSRRPGFTLLELLIVLAILSVVVGIAVPPLRGAVKSTRLETARQTLIGDLRLARTEAIRRNRSVTVTITGANTYNIQFLGGRTLKEGVRFSAGPSSIQFAAFGALLTGATNYSLRLENTTAVVRLSTAGNASAAQ